MSENFISRIGISLASGNCILESIENIKTKDLC